MLMGPWLRKFALTTHVTSSLGWLGAVVGFLALAIVGLTSENQVQVRSAYVAMELIAWTVIVPLSIASLLSGLIQGLGTHWGLFRHYWVVAKLFITVIATLILMVHLRPVGHMADAVAAAVLAEGEMAGLRMQLIADAGAAVIALLITTTLSIYKPQGLTPYGWKKTQA